MNFANDILDAIEIMVKQVVEDNATKIYTGVCKTIDANNCVLTINGKDNAVKYYGGIPVVGTVYQVFIPFGNMSAAFIIVPGSGGGSGGSGVDSVNGMTGEVVLSAADVGALPNTTTIPSKTSQLTNDSGYITASGAPVQSVDGETGTVVTNAIKSTQQNLSDAQKAQARINIGAGTSSFDGNYSSLSGKPTIPSNTSQLNNDSGFITSENAPVKSVNNKTGEVVLSAADVGLSNVDNIRQYSESNPPPYPVISVDGATGAVETNSVKWTDVQEKLVSSSTQVPNAKAVVDAISASGGGDMLKANYATRSDTIVNAAFQDGAGNEINTTYTPLITFNALYSRWPIGVATRPIANCHDITESGIYWVVNGDPNRPPDSDYDYYVLAIAYSDIWMNLIGVDPRRNKMWIKNKNNGVFGPWNNVTQQILVQAGQPTGQSMGSLWYQVI